MFNENLKEKNFKVGKKTGLKFNWENEMDNGMGSGIVWLVVKVLIGN